MLRATAAERALNRSALPNFVNFMRFLHPGRACAAKFASSTAELGWDASLLHCKRPRLVVPSFGGRVGESAHFPVFLEHEHNPGLALRQCAVEFPPGCGLDARGA